MTSAYIDKISERLKATLDEEKNSTPNLSSNTESENYRQVLEYEAMLRVLKRVQKGEEGLYDPNNSGDRLCLLVASM